MFVLNAAEIDALVRVLDEHIPQLRVEIHRTDYNRALREELEAHEALLSDLRERMTQSTGRTVEAPRHL